MLRFCLAMAYYITHMYLRFDISHNFEFIIPAIISILLFLNVCERHILSIVYDIIAIAVVLFESKLHSPLKWFLYTLYCCAYVYLVRFDGPSAVVNIFFNSDDQMTLQPNEFFYTPTTL